MKAKDLTAVEKAKLVMGANFWTNETLGGRVYEFVVSDGPVGLRQPTDRTAAFQVSYPSIAYPATVVLSQTWNKELAALQGKALGNDCIEQNVDTLLGPGVNIKRDPLNGRNFEYYSEDPYLAGTMAREYISGVQSMHVGTCIKHFCCNNMEFSRHWASMEVDERTLREIYLKPFEIACEAKPWSLMCSYNLVNGRRMSENKKLYDVLHHEFGFDGLIISDWEAVKDPVASLNAGLGLEMPYNEVHHKEMMEKAEKGLLDPISLDYCADSVLSFAKKCEETKKLRKIDMTADERREVALKVEEEGIVLLKNKDNILPLRKDASVFVTGAPSIKYYCGGGSSEVKPELPFVSLKEALEEEGFDTTYGESVLDNLGGKGYVDNVKHGLDIALMKDYAIICVGDPNNVETEAFDRQTMKLSKEEECIILEYAKALDRHVIVVIEAGSSIDMSSWIDEVDAVLFMGYGGEMGHIALSHILSGKVSPSGRLSETFPLSYEDTPASRSYRDGSIIRYSEGLDVGYRYYETYLKPVLFPFGYGLSYASFEYSNMEVKEEGEDYLVSLDIENTSSIDAKEVVQLYVKELVKEVYRPVYELKEFTKVSLSAHEKKTVTLRLSKKAFSYYSVAYDCWRYRPGMFEIMVGKDSHNMVLKKRVEVR